MTKAELVVKIQEKAGFDTKAAAGRALDAVLDSIQETLSKGDGITFTGFGSFKVVQREARTGRNPQTGKKIKIPATKVVKFSAGKNLKEAVK